MDNDVTQLLVSRLDRIDSTLTVIQAHTASIDVTLAAQASDLKYHIRRSDTADANLALLRGEFEPIKDHVRFIQGFGKLLAGIAVIIGIIEGITQILA
jgi:hypothetical protein